MRAEDRCCNGDAVAFHSIQDMESHAMKRRGRNVLPPHHAFFTPLLSRHAFQPVFLVFLFGDRFVFVFRLIKG